MKLIKLTFCGRPGEDFFSSPAFLEIRVLFFCPQSSFSSYFYSTRHLKSTSECNQMNKTLRKYSDGRVVAAFA